MVKIECNICFETFAVDRFRFLKCGHGFCVGCSDQLASQKKCPICKARKNHGDAHPIFASFVDPETSTNLQEKRHKGILDVAEGLRKIDASTSSRIIKLAGRQIRDILSSGHGKKELAQLLNVAEGLEERVYPVYVRAEDLSKENEALRASIKALSEGYQKSLSTVAEENTMLRESVAGLEAAARIAQTQANQEYVIAEALRGQVNDLQAALQVVPSVWDVDPGAANRRLKTSVRRPFSFFFR
ncbi:hypothetical protein HGRIS_011455 [Hohenbuehelia grisea]|uniref:RING-type domain-containing protein n=1 Tax=Hohenbuehelia grisea TaxID=104357 RepID=A0ABR3JV34_9AGAR